MEDSAFGSEDGLANLFEVYFFHQNCRTLDTGILELPGEALVKSTADESRNGLVSKVSRLDVNNLRVTK